ncbi:uncharacterized protein [Parasteatoda tepidariorum]|nr:uncharacterized protein LOC107453099 [Parasteatoda tepidariorum]
MPTKRALDFIHSKDPLQYPDKKASKPLMEKRRRARINHSLAQLKSLIIDPNTTEKSRQSKLEKADILELTVRHLHEIKRRQRTVSLLEGRNPRRKFEIGYTECAREVDLFLSSLVDSTVNSELHRRLTQHLSRRLHDLKNIEPIKETVNTCETEESSISSSSHTKNSENQTVLPEHYPPSEPGIQAKTPEKENFYKHYTSECDTTATNLSTSLSSSNNINLLKEQSTGHSQVSSSSAESITFDESNGYRSTSSSPNVFEPKELPRMIEACDPFDGHPKTPIETIVSSELALREKMHQNFKQIPLVPKHLPNGEWALVLPHDMTENEVQNFSAFKLVLPSAFPDLEQERLQPEPLNMSNTSNSENEMNSDQYFSRTYGEPSNNFRFRENFDCNLNSQCVWRPW